MMFHADRMRYREIVKYNKASADFVISPDLDEFHWADFDKARGFVKRGEKETLDVADELLKAIRRHRLKSIFLPPIFRRSRT